MGKSDTMTPVADLPSLPAFLRVEEFLQQRVGELELLKSDMATSNTQKKNKRSFQLLPKWNRRRAQSHNPFRIPRAYRDGTLKELEQNKPKICRRRRRDRRRSRRLLMYYHQRSCRHQWLEETHLWHAKRFHMKSIWNYRLAWESCEKQKRRVYRFAKHKSVIHDKSYMNVIQLEGRLDHLKRLFNRINPVADTLMFSTALLSGGQRGSIHLFYPYSFTASSSGVRPCVDTGPSYMGHANFLWIPEANPSELRRLWLFFHPSLLHRVVEMFQQLLEVIQHELSEGDLSSDQAFLTMKRIKHLALFEISGRLALSHLVNVLRVVKPTTRGSDLWSGTTSGLWDVLCECSLYNPPLPDGAVLALPVSIPEVLGPFPSRHHRQLQKDNTKLKPFLEQLYSLLISWPYETLGARTEAFFSLSKSRQSTTPQLRQTFRSRKRKNISNLLLHLKHLQEQHIEHQRKAHPKLNQDAKDHSFPQVRSRGQRSTMPQRKREVSNFQTTILVIRRCSTPSAQGSYNGYDILFPPSTNAGSFWTLLSRQNTCAVGVNERHSLMTDSGVVDFPWDFPETEAGRLHSIQQAREFVAWYNKRPPSKRVNYAALGLPYPFQPDWHWVHFTKPSSLCHVLNNPLREPQAYSLRIIRPVEPLSMWDIRCLVPRESIKAFNSHENSICLGHLVCCLLLSGTAAEAEKLVQGVVQMNCVSDIFLSVLVTPMENRIPVSRTHLYLMNTLSIEKALAQGNAGIFSHSFAQPLWSMPSHLSPFQGKKKKSNFKTVVPIDSQYKTSKKKNIPKSHFDEFGQIGAFSKNHSRLAGFVTSGCSSFHLGHGIGLACITLKSFFESFVNLRYAMEAFYGCSTVKPLRRQELQKIHAVSCQKIDIISKLMGNKLLDQLCLPFWFQTPSSSIQHPCWIKLLVDAPHSS